MHLQIPERSELREKYELGEVLLAAPGAIEGDQLDAVETLGLFNETAIILTGAIGRVEGIPICAHNRDVSRASSKGLEAVLIKHLDPQEAVHIPDTLAHNG